MFGRSTKADKPQQAPASANNTRSTKGLSPSVIATGMHVLGNIVSEGTLDIDGRIDGNVRAHTISLRQNGFIRGDIAAETIHVHGTVDGLIKARHVMLYADAKVTGTIMHESITIEDGAFVDGKFKRTDSVQIGDADLAAVRLLHAPTVDVVYNDNDNDVDAEPSEAEIKILENLRLIS